MDPGTLAKQKDVRWKLKESKIWPLVIFLMRYINY